MRRRKGSSAQISRVKFLLCVTLLCCGDIEANPEPRPVTNPTLVTTSNTENVLTRSEGSSVVPQKQQQRRSERVRVALASTSTPAATCISVAPVGRSIPAAHPMRAGTRAELSNPAAHPEGEVVLASTPAAHLDTEGTSAALPNFASRPMREGTPAALPTTGRRVASEARYTPSATRKISEAATSTATGYIPRKPVFPACGEGLQY